MSGDSTGRGWAFDRQPGRYRCGSLGLARVLALMSDPEAFAVLECLGENGPLTPAELSDTTGMTKGKIQRALGVLRAFDLVDDPPRG